MCVYIFFALFNSGNRYSLTSKKKNTCITQTYTTTHSNPLAWTRPAKALTATVLRMLPTAHHKHPQPIPWSGTDPALLVTAMGHVFCQLSLLALECRPGTAEPLSISHTVVGLSMVKQQSFGHFCHTHL